MRWPLIDVRIARTAALACSRLLRAVRRGRSALVTSHGKPVARIVLAAENDRTQGTAHSPLLARLRRERVVTIGRWSRDERYEDIP